MSASAATPPTLVAAKRPSGPRRGTRSMTLAPRPSTSAAMPCATPTTAAASVSLTRKLSARRKRKTPSAVKSPSASTPRLAKSATCCARHIIARVGVSVNEQRARAHARASTSRNVGGSTYALPNALLVHAPRQVRRELAKGLKEQAIEPLQDPHGQ